MKSGDDSIMKIDLSQETAKHTLEKQLLHGIKKIIDDYSYLNLSFLKFLEVS